MVWVKIYPEGIARGAHSLSSCTQSKSSTGKSLSEAQTVSSARWSKKPKKGRFRRKMKNR